MSSKTKCWLWMLLVILSETSATSTLKMFDNSEGMIKTLLLALIVVLYCICYYSLSRAVKDIPVGLAYATWSGTGILMSQPLGFCFTVNTRIPPPLLVWSSSPAVLSL